MIEGRVLVPGTAEGPVLSLDQPLSLWGGLDPVTGLITDVRHPQHGVSVSGTVLVLRTGRGSSSSSTILAEAIRLGTSPAAIIVTETDPVLVVGALVAARLYGRAVPVVRVPQLDEIRRAVRASVGPTGLIEIHHA